MIMILKLFLKIGSKNLQSLLILLFIFLEAAAKRSGSRKKPSHTACIGSNGHFSKRNPLLLFFFVAVPSVLLYRIKISNYNVLLSHIFSLE